MCWSLTTGEICRRCELLVYERQELRTCFEARCVWGACGEPASQEKKVILPQVCPGCEEELQDETQRKPVAELWW